MLTAPRTSVGATFALPGPRTYTYASLVSLVSAMTLKSHRAPTLPKPVALAIATILNRALWWPTVSPDEVLRKYIDDVGAASPGAPSDAPAGWAAEGASAGAINMTGVSGEPAKGWADLDITPEPIEEHAIKYLRRYRSAWVDKETRGAGGMVADAPGTPIQSNVRQPGRDGALQGAQAVPRCRVGRFLV